jgi:transcriptional regulator with XRE-family HTH domain
VTPRSRQTHRQLAKRVRELVAERGFPVTHLPDRAGVSRSHFWDVMAARRSPTVEWLEAVAGALEVDLVSLFTSSAVERGR